MSTGCPELVEDRRDHIAVLRIERESRLGALSRAMVVGLHDYAQGLAADPDVRVLVLTGTGRSFVAGADIGEYDGVGQEAFDEYQQLSRRTFDALAALPIPTIAAVNGFALGGGLELALCCDFILASDSARLGLPEIGLGLVPGGGGTQRLPRRIGAQAAKALLMTGRPWTAEVAERTGLVHGCFARNELDAGALALATELADAAPMAVRAIKRLVDAADARGLAEGLTEEQSELSRLFATHDGKEGIRAFIEKRRPAFAGA